MQELSRCFEILPAVNPSVLDEPLACSSSFGGRDPAAPGSSGPSTAASALRNKKARSAAVGPLSPRGLGPATSAELLLEAKWREQQLAEQEERRRKLLAEIEHKKGQQPKAGAKRKRRTCKQRLAFYATSSLALVAISGGCALLFLVPLYVDPAVSTILADFFPEPVTCTTSRREDLWGLFNCTWSSCREGCTSEVYRCTHIYVTYSPWSNYSSLEANETLEGAAAAAANASGPPAPSTAQPTSTEQPEIVQAVLLVNIKGCGYPPVVDCENFTRELGYEGSRFPCYYSRVNGSIVMADYNREAEVTIILHYFAAPLVMTLATTAVLCVWHCDCRCQPPPRRYHHQQHGTAAAAAGQTNRRIAKSARPNDLSEYSISTQVERRGHPVHCKCSEVMRPL